MFLKLDFSKVHDKIDLQFLFQAIQMVGFLEALTNMTKILFHNTAARVYMNGQVTDAFPIEQGV